MHELVFYGAALWMTVLLVVSVGVVVRAGSALSRILALDMLILILVALLVLFAAATRTPYYLDAAVVLSLLAVVTTLAAVRYHGGEEPFG
ncbi:MAG: MrpF/PhaF family protein [Thermoleophilia bacterium]|nr:MrpF/PhaF family protein [Thermoleophilia bacterium]